MVARKIVKYYYGWNIVAYVALLQIFSMGMLSYSFGIMLLPWMESFAASRQAITVIPVAGQLAIMLASPLAGQFVDRIPPRTSIAIGIGVLVASLLLIAGANSVTQLILIHVTFVAVALLLAGALVAQTTVAKWFVRRRGLALAFTAAGAGAGGLLMPPILQHLIDIVGWRDAFVAAAIGAAVVLAPLMFIIRKAPEQTDPREIASLERTGPAAATISALKIVTDQTFLMTTFGVATASSIHLVMQYNLPALGHDSGVSPARSAWLLSMLAGASICSKPVWGTLIDRTEPRFIYIAVVAAYTMSLAVLLGLLGTLGFGQLLTAAALSGFASGAIQPLLGVVLALRFGAANIGKALGLAYPIMALSAVGPIIAAVAYTHTGSYGSGLWILGGMLLVSMIVLERGLRPKRAAWPAPEV
jgi:MFS family permease